MSNISSSVMPDNLHEACRPLQEEDLFSPYSNSVAARIKAIQEAAGHYLNICDGQKIEIETNYDFQGKFLQPYFETVGLTEPAAITYTALRAAGWPAYATLELAEQIAGPIRESHLFDAETYAALAKLPAHLDPALHYVLVGERLGLPPSARFDPDYYKRRYPEIANIGSNYLSHYLTYGQRKGMRPVSLAATLPLDVSHLDSVRKTVLLISHQASRTGAPILAYNIALKLREKYNVVVIFLLGGELVDDFRKICTSVIGPFKPDHDVESDYLVKRLIKSFDVFYVIANTIDSRDLLKPLTCQQVPVVTLVHEFASYLRPKGSMGSALEWTTEVVFSAESVLDSVKAEYPNIVNRRYHILRQGPSVLPAARDRKSLREHRLREAVRPPGFEDAFVVLGCGTIYMRKGVDLFLSCAAAVAALKPKRPVRFVWIGQRLEPHIDGDYYNYLSEQIRRSSLGDNTAILDEVSDLEPAYSSADAFFLSSRLDPLPNVAIDAALRGIPIVCFENAGGIAEILKTDAITRISVVPYVDVNAAATVIAKLADEPVAYQEYSRAISAIGQAVFDMDSYVAKLDAVGQQAVRAIRQRFQDFETINNDPSFDLTMFLGNESVEVTRAEGIRLFLARAAALGVGNHATTNFYYRRPCPGFHPQIYALDNASNYEVATTNPLAHFIRSGKPKGPWRHDVIPVPKDAHLPFHTSNPLHASNRRIAVHAHFYYHELAEDFLRRLSTNSENCDLLISTDSPAKANFLQKTLGHYDRGKIFIRVVPNRGRDIGPLLSEFHAEVMTGYDIVGHFHGKRTATADVILGETWRGFLWENLLGGIYPMMDVVLNHMAEDENIGLVFAEDAHLSDWDLNRDVATTLAQRMGIERPLPPYFDFPIGTMFWARTSALRPLFELNLGWNDYPTEPIPTDGTILHAIERLIPFIARHAGFRFATTNIPGVTW